MLLNAYRAGAGTFVLIASAPACAADGPAVLGIPVDFILFGLTLVGVAVFHRHTLRVALAGLAVITLYKLAFTGFKTGGGIPGLLAHLHQEWVILTNLLCLLLGFALLSRHFEKTHLPAALPRFLPHDWKGCFALLAIVFVLSSFLDNIAAALIGGAMAHTLFRAKVHIGYLAAIVAASNAGRSGSVVGDTTTTMMWIDGVDPVDVMEAYVGAGVALVICGIPAALQQQRYSPILRHDHEYIRIDWIRLGIVFFILITAIVTNVVMNVGFPDSSDRFPFIGASVVIALLLTVPLRRPDWEVLPESFKGSVFLLSLVLSATMMPVEKLPAASWHTAMGLGFVSAVFDNIPLTALALKQGGYDWGYLAYGVRVGGSMILVRLERRRGLVEYVSRGEIGRALALPRLARDARLCGGFLRAALCDGMASQCAPQGGQGHGESACGNDPGRSDEVFFLIGQGSSRSPKRLDFVAD